jgi:hypothetical protein
LQDFIGARLALDKQSTVVLYQIDLVTLFEAKFAHKIGRQPDRERIPPFCNLHGVVPPSGYTSLYVYHLAAIAKISMRRRRRTGLCFDGELTQDVEKTCANPTLTAIVTETRQKTSITVNTPKMRSADREGR